MGVRSQVLGEPKMDKILQQVHKKLIQKKKTVAVAESCTGGELSALLTKNAGASGYFLLGIIAYSNRNKEKLLKIPSRKIKEFGAVSKETAILMAKNIRIIARSDFGLSVTGIAGPKGATPGKPIGTLFIALANRKQVICKKLGLSGNRSKIRKQAVEAALRLLKPLI